MKLPVLAYGNTLLTQKAENISPGYPRLKQLISDMWETMYAADGAGLAAPQIGKPVRIFIVDTVQSYESGGYKGREKFVGDTGIKEVFINPQVTEVMGNTWTAAEGCLSIPALNLDIERRMSVSIKYFDEEFNSKERFFSGATARAVMHEYDHLEGILFTDYVDIQPIAEQLKKISSGKVKVNYKMKFNK